MTAMNEKNREDRLLDRVFELAFEEEAAEVPPEEENMTVVPPALDRRI